MKENIETIRKQVKIVLIIDNASDNVVDIRQMIKEYKNVYMICNTVNKGIAVALKSNMSLFKRTRNGLVLIIGSRQYMF